jgi:septal ring factor EnvC (AmiA/AmiB activator)
MEQCTAHGLVIETVQGLRENQKETYSLIRNLTAEVAENNKEASNTLTELKAWRVSFEAKQDERHEELKAIVRQLKPKKWTPQSIIGLVGAIFGGGGIATVLIFFIK